jgi:hypothetical protein
LFLFRLLPEAMVRVLALAMLGGALAADKVKLDVFTEAG